MEATPEAALSGELLPLPRDRQGSVTLPPSKTLPGAVTSEERPHQPPIQATLWFLSRRIMALQQRLWHLEAGLEEHFQHLKSALYADPRYQSPALKSQALSSKNRGIQPGHQSHNQSCSKCQKSVIFRRRGAGAGAETSRTWELSPGTWRRGLYEIHSISNAYGKTFSRCPYSIGFYIVELYTLLYSICLQY